MAKTGQSRDKEKIKIEIESKDKNEETEQPAKNKKPARESKQEEKKDSGTRAAGSAEGGATGDAAGDAAGDKGDKGASEKTAEETLAAEKDRYLRLAAEYDNFRKRTAKERDMTYANAKADVIGRLLPVYDNLERAIRLECSDEAYYKGIEMTMLQLTEILKDLGVTPIPAAGEQFDPNLHNAVMRVEDPEKGEGIITEECQKGFTLGDRVIRHATVVVAN